MKFYDINCDYYDDGINVYNYIYNQNNRINIIDLCLTTFSNIKPKKAPMSMEDKILWRILKEFFK